METSAQSIQAFSERLQDGLNSLKNMEGTIDQAYINFCSSEQESVSVRLCLHVLAGCLYCSRSRDARY